MSCKDNERVVLALIFIGLGAVFLMNTSMLWPMFILGPGLVMLWLAASGGKTGAAAMSIPGMLVTGTGALLFVQNITGYWSSWAYAWTLFGVFLGMGFMLMGQKLEDSSLHNLGRVFAQVSLVGFGLFAFFFEAILKISGGVGPLFPVLLIGLGLYLLSRGMGSDGLRALLSSSSGDIKLKNKPKRSEDKLFTGPIVYGTRATPRDSARLSVPEEATSADPSARK